MYLLIYANEPHALMQVLSFIKTLCGMYITDPLLLPPVLTIHPITIQMQDRRLIELVPNAK